MTIDINDLLNSIMESLDRFEFVETDDIPNISLYMDQVTSFMDKKLKKSTRHQDTDKILTKTMINNYAKNDLLPPPIKKKYNKEHLMVLIFIYYFKNILSITDIKNMLNPLTSRYFGEDEEFSIEDVYNEVTRVSKTQMEALKADIRAKYNKAMESFDEAEGKREQEFLQMFSFICMLSFDVYSKKLLIEKLLDEFADKYGDKE